MLRDEKINASQFMILAILFTIGSSILIVPASLVVAAKQDGWISAIIAMVIGIMLVLLYTALAKRQPGKSFPVMIESLMGKRFGKVILVLYFFFAFTLAALVLRNFGDFLVTKIMLETPHEAIHLLFLVPVVYAIKLGLETYSRVAEITFPFAAILFIILITLTSPEIEFTNIQPIFGEGMKKIFGGSLTMIGVPFLELIILTTYFSSINKPQKLRVSFLVGVVIGSSFLILTTLFTILVLGVELTSLKVFPAYVWAKKLSIADFLERIEVIIAAVWGISLFFKLVLSFHASMILFGKLFNLKDYRLLVIPMSFILYTYSMVAYPNSAYFIKFATETWLSFALLFGFIFPSILLLLSYMKKDEVET